MITAVPRTLSAETTVLPLGHPFAVVASVISDEPFVIADDLFKGVLVRERKRADRSNESLLLVLVQPHAARDTGSMPIWPAIVDALGAAKSETDILGWYERGQVLGLLVPGIAAFDRSLLHQVSEGVRSELFRRLDGESVARVSIRVYAYPHSTAAEAHGVRPIDPIVNRASLGEKRRMRYDGIKRALDVVASLMLLAVLSPVFLVVAALLKLTSRGPVLFRQERIGLMMKPFVMLKFRTMHVNGDETIHQQFVSSFITAPVKPQQVNGTAVFKIVNDPRVTPIGRTLRRTSLDELPQLWNVLRGDMSLVGPRPPLAYEVERYQPWHKGRVLDAKPGLTGLWQVSGRSRMTFDEMVRLDLHYARTCSLLTDIRILLATPGAVISGKGAC